MRPIDSIVGKARVVSLSLLLVIACTVLALLTPEAVLYLTGYDSWGTYFDSRNRHLLLGSLATGEGSIEIAVDPLEEFDFKTKAQVLSHRRAVVSKYPQIAGTDYEPSSKVFGEIVDGVPWWGIHGLYFYGPGEKGIDGLSEESRFINNPFLLIGLLENRAWVTSLSPEKFEHYYPEPESIIYFPKESRVEVIYSVRRFFDHQIANHYSNSDKRIIALSAYNARDFGYNYMYIDPRGTSGVDIGDQQAVPFPIWQFIHKGGSCGYPGGCNNMSPYQQEMDLIISFLPSTLSIKLWRVKPILANDKEDLLYKILMR